jgi:hypothetical protein
MSSPTPGYLYVIWLREFLEQDEPVYEVGHTSDLCERLAQYPKESRLLFSVWIEDTRESERQVYAVLNDFFLHRTDIGRNYYEGNLQRILRVIWDAYQAAQDTYYEVKNARETTEWCEGTAGDELARHRREANRTIREWFKPQ